MRVREPEPDDRQDGRDLGEEQHHVQPRVAADRDAGHRPGDEDHGGRGDVCAQALPHPRDELCQVGKQPQAYDRGTHDRQDQHREEGQEPRGRADRT